MDVDRCTSSCGSRRLRARAYADIAFGPRAAAYGHARAAGGNYLTDRCSVAALRQSHKRTCHDPRGAGNSNCASGNARISCPPVAAERR